MLCKVRNSLPSLQHVAAVYNALVVYHTANFLTSLDSVSLTNSLLVQRRCSQAVFKVYQVPMMSSSPGRFDRMVW